MEAWPFAREVRIFDELESTSDRARSMVQGGNVALPIAVWAGRQTLGRGQRHSSWWSDEGSLTFTIALDPAAHGLRVEQEPRLALTTAVAVIEALGAVGLADPRIGIRWPNDVEAGGRKLCGILPERVDTAGGHRLLIGVGLNVRTRFDLAPEAVARMATSLEVLQSRPLEPETLPRLLAAILARFEVALGRLAHDDPGLSREWDRLNQLRGQAVQIALGPRLLVGKAREIDPQGALCVDDGRQLHHLFAGRVLREAP
jgi:BirA family biotin operon repressor/biotin-[acetyl-CoA-carboxylase] ligase